MPDALSAYLFYAGFAVVVALAVRRWASPPPEPEPAPATAEREWEAYYAYLKSYYAAAQALPPVTDARLTPYPPPGGGWTGGSTGAPRA